MSLLERIKDLVQEKGINIKALEASAGIGNGTIRRWDNSPPSADKLLKVAYLLNTSMDYLMTGENTDHSMPDAEDIEWLSLIHQLPRDAQLEFRGEIKGYLKRMESESVAADEPLKQAK